METVSFKERVANTSILQARPYKDTFVDYEYLLCSDAFVKQNYYIITAQEDNYRHLIGVSTNISAADFFKSCMDGRLTESDFSFTKRGRSESSIKGSVRRKIRALPIAIGMFSGGMLVQEDFAKNGKYVLLQHQME